MSLQSKDEFGDRMKLLEREGTQHRVPREQILAVRIDGKGFSRFTKFARKPFDVRITDLMDHTAKTLTEEFKPNVTYVQSDEISMIFSCTEDQKEHVFGGKLSKINSIMASVATAAFNGYSRLGTPKPAYFDCRAWGVPDMAEASNVLLWRAQDCRKNSISSCYRWVGHKKQMPVQAEMLDYLKSHHDFDWTKLSPRDKFGAYFGRVNRPSVISDEIWETIPERQRPVSRVVLRSSVEQLNIGDFTKFAFEDRVALAAGTYMKGFE